MTFAEAHDVIDYVRRTGQRTRLLLAAETFADEVDRLNAEIARVVQDYEDMTYILNNLNEALADAFPALAEHIDHHPAAHLRVVTADTATPCEPPQ